MVVEEQEPLIRGEFDVVEIGLLGDAHGRADVKGGAGEQHLQLAVEILSFFFGHGHTVLADSDGVHETHSVELNLVVAAPTTKDFAAPPAMVLNNK